MAFKKITLAASAALAGVMLVPSAASAQHNGGYNDGYYQQVQYNDRYDDRRYRRDVRRANRRAERRAERRYNRRYRRGDYYEGNRGYRDDRRYRGRCRDNGTGGTIIGAIAGGLLGREVAEGRRGRGDRTAGTIIGAGIGAIAGRAIDRDC